MMTKKKIRRIKIDTLICYIVIILSLVLAGWHIYQAKTAGAQVLQELGKGEYLGTYTITAYCPCPVCCGEWAHNRSNGLVIGSGGVPLYEGTHVASSLPNKSRIYIEGIGTYEVQDTPANHIIRHYDGKIIDIYFANHEAALKFGKKTAKVYTERVKL